MNELEFEKHFRESPEKADYIRQIHKRLHELDIIKKLEISENIKYRIIVPWGVNIKRPPDLDNLWIEQDKKKITVKTIYDESIFNIDDVKRIIDHHTETN